MLSFATIPAALDRLAEIVSTGPVAVEMLDRMILDLAGENPLYSHYLNFAEGRPADIAVLIAEHRLDSNISVKLTALGLKLDARRCLEQFDEILKAARAHGNFVRIDMEDSSVTEETIRIYLESRKLTDSVGLPAARRLPGSAGPDRAAARPPVTAGAPDDAVNAAAGVTM